MMKIVHTGTNQRYGGPVEMVQEEGTAVLMGCSRVYKGADVLWMLIAIITTQSIMFEGSRL